MEATFKSTAILVATLVGVGPAACVGDPPTTPHEDTGTHSGDPGSGSDAGSSSDPGTADEVCDDASEADEDGDGAANCADADCEDNSTCRPPAENCWSEGDEDGNGVADCEDCACFGICDPPPCGYGPRCACDALCVGNACVATHQTPETYEPAARWSYISALQVPEHGGAAECCFDFNGDGRVDNGLATVLTILGGTAGELDTWLPDAFVQGTISLLAEYRADDLDPWKATPGGSIGLSADDLEVWKAAPRLSFWLGTSDLDGDGAPDQDSQTRAGGGGIFRVESGVFTSTGAPTQFNTGYYLAGTLAMDPSIFVLTLPPNALIAGLGSVSLELERARLEATLDDVTPTFSIQEIIEDVEYGGARLGGVLQLAQVFDALDAAARSCTCSPEIDGTAAVIVHGEHERLGRYGATCAQASYDVSACDPETQRFCAELLNPICGAVSGVADLPLADLDTDGSGINDAVSVGVRLTMAPATLDAQWIESEGSGG